MGIGVLELCYLSKDTPPPPLFQIMHGPCIFGLYCQEAGSPLTSRTYAKWLDASNADRDLDEEEARATERFLKRYRGTYIVVQQNCIHLDTPVVCTDSFSFSCGVFWLCLVFIFEALVAGGS